MPEATDLACDKTVKRGRSEESRAHQREYQRLRRLDPVFAERERERNRQYSHRRRQDPDTRATLYARTAEYQTSEAGKLSKRKSLLKRHGITQERFDAIWIDQGGVCRICLIDLETVIPHIDHDHGHCSGMHGCSICVRGLLCGPCNKALGLFRDNETSLARALEYARAHKSKDTSNGSN